MLLCQMDAFYQSPLCLDENWHINPEGYSNAKCIDTQSHLHCPEEVQLCCEGGFGDFDVPLQPSGQ